MLPAVAEVYATATGVSMQPKNVNWYFFFLNQSYYFIFAPRIRPLLRSVSLDVRIMNVYKLPEKYFDN